MQTLWSNPLRQWLPVILLAGCISLYAGPGLTAHAQEYDLADNVIRHYRHGENLMQRKRYAEAIEEFKIALRLNPYSTMSAAIYNNLGVSYRELKNMPMALASFQRAIRIQPRYELYYKNLIVTWAQDHRLSEAKKALNTIVQRNPVDAEAWFLLGLSHERSGHLRQASEAFSRFIELEPHSRLVRAAKTRQ